MPDYIDTLEELLTDALQEEAVHDKYRKMQLAITTATLQAACPPEKQAREEHSPRTLLDQLIAQRKALPTSEATQRCQISKDIRKELKKIKD